MFLEQGVQNIVSRLQPTRRTSETMDFPPDWNVAEGRVGSNETIHQWYKRCLDDILQSNPEQAWVNEKLAIFLSVRWKKRTEIVFISCQTLITPKHDLCDFYVDPKIPVQYYRLDYHPEERGKIFSHPLVHLHSNPHDEPRFPFLYGRENIIGDYFDFIYRNYFPDLWKQWFEDSWKKVAANRNWTDIPFDSVCQRFMTLSSKDLLAQHENHLQKMKEAIDFVKSEEQKLKVPKHLEAFDWI